MNELEKLDAAIQEEKDSYRSHRAYCNVLEWARGEYESDEYPISEHIANIFAHTKPGSYTAMSGSTPLWRSARAREWYDTYKEDVEEYWQEVYGDTGSMGGEWLQAIVDRHGDISPDQAKEYQAMEVFDYFLVKVMDLLQED
jgi:hypothetical protein